MLNPRGMIDTQIEYKTRGHVSCWLRDTYWTSQANWTRTLAQDGPAWREQRSACKRSCIPTHMPKSKREPAEKTPPVRRRNRAGTEASLVDAAAAVFAERGYEAATTKTIAERAGCSEALIQVYFQGKEGLLSEVISREVARLPEESAFFDRPLRADFETEAQETLAFIVDLLGRHLGGMRIIISRTLIDSSFWMGSSKPSVRDFLRVHLRSRFERYVAAKRLPPTLDSARVAEMLLALGFTLGFLDHEVFRVDAIERKHRLSVYAKVFGQGVSAARRREEQPREHKDKPKRKRA